MFNFREVFCVPKYVISTDQLWKHMVDVIHCTDQEIPHQNEECNRYDCCGITQTFIHLIQNISLFLDSLVLTTGRSLTGQCAALHVDLVSKL